MNDHNLRSKAHVNRNRHSFEEDLATLTGYLHNCLKITDKPFINRSGQRSIFVNCYFPNGERSITIQQAPEVSNLLNDFMMARGQFKKSDEPPSFTTVVNQD